MWFNGMGLLFAFEFIEKAKESIQKAIWSCESDYGAINQERIENLKAALALLSE